VSNFLAIATVTETLRQRLQSALDPVVGGVTVTPARPETPAGTATPPPRVNLYLYQVTPNGAWRNADLPTRREGGALAQRPQVALDLHYLLTFYGEEAALVPQRLLGATASLLHERPVVTREMVRAAIDALTASDPTHFLATSDLAEQVELVRITPAAMSLEELSKLWSVFFQTPYALSVAYLASVVLIEADVRATTGLPVQTRNLRVLPFRQPVIDRVGVQVAADKPLEERPISPGETLVLRGQGLRGDHTQVRLGGLAVPIPDATDREIRLTLGAPALDPAALRAGVQAVQVIHKIDFGTPADPHAGLASNAAAIVLRPRVTTPALAGAHVTVHLDPPVGQRQRAVLLLHSCSSAVPAAFAFVAEPRSADATELAFAVGAIAPDRYFVRVQVDGAESRLDVDPASPGYGPTINLP
jgi:hypothetical protein